MRKVLPPDAVIIPDTANKVFAGQIFDVYQWPQKMFNGSTEIFEMLRRPDTVSVIGVVQDQILVIDDDQPHTGSRASFPGGRVDNTDKSTLTAARREMLEETGHQFAHWRLVKVWQPHTKLEWFVYLYLAWDGKKVSEPHLDAGERITVKSLGFDEVRRLAITKSGYLAESKEVFERLNSLDNLLALPEFSGQIVDR